MNEKRRPQAQPFRRTETPPEETEGQLEGRNALQEALKSGRTIDKVFIAEGDTDRENYKAIVWDGKYPSTR